MNDLKEFKNDFTMITCKLLYQYLKKDELKTAYDFEQIEKNAFSEYRMNPAFAIFVDSLSSIVVFKLRDLYYENEKMKTIIKRNGLADKTVVDSND